MKIDNIAIYIDIKHLHETIYRAQFTMTKADRIVMGNRLLDLSQGLVAILSRAVAADLPEERLPIIDQLRGEFDALRLNLQTAEHLRLFKESRQTVDRENGDHNREHIGPLVLAMFERVGKIDEGLGKWRSATKARFTSFKK